uniref:Polyprotein protein n=1 Tax=Solanum tuberosum TaxID=4113 RepID=M1DYC6_SOLTU
MQRAAPVDLSPVVVTDSIPAEASLPTPAPGPSGTSIATASFADTPGSSVAALPPKPAGAVSRTPITHASLLRMGQLAHSADCQVAKLETSIPNMIQTALTDAVTPLRASIDALEARIELKATDMSMVFGTMEILDVPEMPPTTTENEYIMEQTAESEPDTDEGMLEETERATNEDLTETEEAMIDAVVQASMANTPFG